MNLARGVHACVDGDTAVFLDLRRNRYLSAPLAQSAGGSAQQTSAAALPIAALDGPQLRALGAAGLIEPPAPAPDADIEDVIEAARGLVRLQDWIGCVRAWLWARNVVASKRLDLGLAELARLAAVQRGSAPSTVAAALTAHERFERIRPFAPAARVCLFDSLALAHFLLAEGLSISLVFGVRVRPFGAHCWVEWGDHVLNDRGGHARFYQEILRARL